MTKFDSSLRDTMQYIERISEFVENLIKTSKVCPFQVDLVLAMGKPHKMDDAKYDDEDDDDDEEDEDDDDEEKYFDYVGDIKAKLEKNQLPFVTVDGKPSPRLFDDLYKQYKDANKLGDEKEDEEYLRKRRIVALVDRRPHDKGMKDDAKTDPMFMYEPPECNDGKSEQSARNIPNDALPEWYVGATKMVLLPDMKFGNGPSYEKRAAKKEKPVNPKNEDDAEQNTAIHGGFGAAGSVLTLSIQAKQERVV